MRDREAVTLENKGIGPLDYKIDSQALPAMNKYVAVMQTACARKDFDEICRTGSFNVTNMTRNEANLFISIGETLYKYGLPCVFANLKSRENGSYIDMDYTVSQIGTMIGGIVQNGMHSATLEYQKTLSNSGNTEERNVELVDEFILRGIRETHSTLIQNGWKPSEFGVLI